MHPISRWLFKYFWWIIIIGMVLGIVAVLLPGWAATQTTLVGAWPIIAAVLAFFYFVQKQKLAEMHLFHVLFQNFTQRYEKLNNALSKKSPPKQRVVDYCNLCAEEFLFYKEGHIHKEVWRNWCRGMVCHLKKKTILDVFRGELGSNETKDSYYGLSLDEIWKGGDFESDPWKEII
jgi:hypothetical protein